MKQYEEKIFKALEIISNNLDKKLDWKQISRDCFISEYHFHRIFTEYMKETPGSYIKRSRLELAAAYLKKNNMDLSILDIALKCGYSNQASFTKAFKGHFGYTPGSLIKNEKIIGNDAPTLI